MGRKPGSKNKIKRNSATPIPVVLEPCAQRYSIHIYKRFSGYEYAGCIVIQSDEVATNLIPKICSQILEQNKKYYDNKLYNLLDIRAVSDSGTVFKLSIHANIYDDSLNSDISNVSRILNSEALRRKNALIVG